MSQAELAERSDIPKSTLIKLEQGVIAAPKLIDVAAIAVVLGGTCADYLPNDEPEPESAGSGRPPAVEAPKPRAVGKRK